MRGTLVGTAASPALAAKEFLQALGASIGGVGCYAISSSLASATGKTVAAHASLAAAGTDGAAVLVEVAAAMWQQRTSVVEGSASWYGLATRQLPGRTRRAGTRVAEWRWRAGRTTDRVDSSGSQNKMCSSKNISYGFTLFIYDRVKTRAIRARSASAASPSAQPLTGCGRAKTMSMT